MESILDLDLPGGRKQIQITANVYRALQERVLNLEKVGIFTLSHFLGQVSGILAPTQAKEIFTIRPTT